MEVGVRALRNGLSKYLAEVHDGKTITVTDHGKVIARIVPADRPTTLERLIAEGVVTPGQPRKRTAIDPIDTGTTISDLVNDQRR